MDGGRCCADRECSLPQKPKHAPDAPAMHKTSGPAAPVTRRPPKQRPTILIVESMCCHKEVPLVTELLMAVTGVQKVDALIALRQVAVWHACDGSVLPQQLADALNAGRLGASVYKAGYTPAKTIGSPTADSAQGGNERYVESILGS
jgi:copper chaperone CopZ